MSFDMAFQGKKNEFLGNTANKHGVINATLNKRMTPG